MNYITVSEHEKAEWSRMAQAAYRESRNAIGHRYSMATTLRKGEQIRLDVFDALQANYRAWLIGGFDYIHNPLYDRFQPEQGTMREHCQVLTDEQRY